jgi:hypothetical protein
MNIAVIPARGGSVRLPKKNIRPFCGHPLIAWSITQAKTARQIDKVYVVTDDEQIAAVSRRYGAEVFMQPEWMKTKKPNGGMPVLYGLMEVKKRGEVDIMVSMLCTNPLVLPGDLDKGIRLIRELDIPSIGPLQPMREIVLIRKLGEYKARTEILSKDYEYLREGGNWEAVRARHMLAFSPPDPENFDWGVEHTMGEFQPSDRYYFPVEVWQYADTDTLEEFEMAEALAKHYILKGRDMLDVYGEYAKADEKTIMQWAELHAGNLAQQR